ncbi:MAG: transposase, partial [Gammaproteobacteria bacterium]
MTTERQVRQKYSEEFKRGSTALVAEQDYIISKTARRVNVNANLLVKWRDRLAKESTGRRSTRDEREQLKRPCKVNRLPTMEQEILKNSQYLMMEMRCSPLPFA